MIRISLCGEHKNIRNQMKLPIMGVSFDCYPALTVRKSPIRSTNNQWGMKKTPTD